MPMRHVYIELPLTLLCRRLCTVVTSLSLSLSLSPQPLYSLWEQVVKRPVVSFPHPSFPCSLFFLPSLFLLITSSHNLWQNTREQLPGPDLYLSDLPVPPPPTSPLPPVHQSRLWSELCCSWFISFQKHTLIPIILLSVENTTMSDQRNHTPTPCLPQSSSDMTLRCHCKDTSVHRPQVAINMRALFYQCRNGGWLSNKHRSDCEKVCSAFC